MIRRLRDAGMTEEEIGLVGQQPQSTSTWRNVWHKIKLMVPYVWPKNSFLLQLCVYASIIFLIAGRIVNLFVPIYYKKIGTVFCNSHTIYF